MAIELNLTKSDNKTPWGFRLIGGSDYNSPLVVVKVTEGSRAQDCGLGVKDIVTKINDIPTEDLTHSESQDLISKSGSILNLCAKRGDKSYFSQGYTGDNSVEQEANDEVMRILEGAREALEKESKKFEPISPHTVGNLHFEKEMTVHNRQEIAQENISQSVASVSSEVSSSHQVQLTFDTREHKWSTFLQKPKNPKPKPKPKEEPRKIEGEPYRVVIQKQPKKKVKFYSDPEQLAELLGEELKEVESEENEVISEAATEINEAELENQLESEYNKEDLETNEEIREEFTNITNEFYENSEENDNATYEIPEKETSPERELTLEERLAEVQRQLEALSQLPTDIQDTLSDVTKKLAEIVGINTDPNKDGERHVTFKLDDEVSLNSEAEIRSPLSSEGIEEDSLEADIGSREDIEDDTLNGGGIERTDDTSSLLDEAEQVEEIDEEAMRREEEARRQEEEIRRLEAEKLEKLEKEEAEKARGPPKPLVRPIVLPGGRKWCDPDDACVRVRQPKMSDEKIANTIEQYSEVITGKLKGINFLKYTPPPKNMDFLQRSEVYRLVHDMEPPVRGISTRSGKILAEEDYYEKARLSPAS